MNITLDRNSFSGICRVPSSKSHSIRALLIASFARSVSKICNLSDCSDVLSCISVCKSFGVRIYNESPSVTVVDSTDLVSEGEVVCNAGESGTTLYFATALSATLGVKTSFFGSESLMKRSAGPLIGALRELGAEISGDVFVPYAVCGVIKGGEVSLDCPTSQYLSALLLACPLAKNDTLIKIRSLNEKPYISMTLYWLDKQGIRYKYDHEEDSFLVYGGQHYRGFTDTVYGDYSAASFLFASAAITGGEVTVLGLNEEDRQGDRRCLSVLEKMGASVSYSRERSGMQSVTVSGSRILHGADVDMNSIPDSLPVLSVVSCFSDREVRLFNIPQARIKETDRLSVMANNLNVIGADITEFSDGLIIRPIDHFRGGRVNSFGDHRIAMAMAVASLRCENPLTIVGADACSVSFPGFFDEFLRLTE